VGIKILIVPLNSPKMGFPAPHFVFLEEHFLHEENFLTSKKFKGRLCPCHDATAPAPLKPLEQVSPSAPLTHCTFSSIPLMFFLPFFFTGTVSLNHWIGILRINFGHSPFWTKATEQNKRQRERDLVQPGGIIFDRDYVRRKLCPVGNFFRFLCNTI